MGHNVVPVLLNFKMWAQCGPSPALCVCVGVGVCGGRGGWREREGVNHNNQPWSFMYIYTLWLIS